MSNNFVTTSPDTQILTQTTPYTLFASDIHLSEARPDITASFLRFLKGMAAEADALYLLGDIFDRWLGDDDPAAWILPIVDELRQYRERNHQLYIMAGNHDFLLGQRFAQRCGAIQLPDPFLFQLYNEPVILSHGDLLCTDDRLHVLWRRMVQTPIFQRYGLKLPLRWRAHVAQQLHDTSQRRHQRRRQLGKPPVDVTSNALQQLHQRYPTAAYLIHGHTHQPAIYQHSRPEHHSTHKHTHPHCDRDLNSEINNNNSDNNDALTNDPHPFTRIVLGDWAGKQATVLKWEATQQHQLLSLTLPLSQT